MNWRTEFLRLIMSASIEDFSAALELKRDHIPEKLYRYRSVNKIHYVLDEIYRGAIYLAHPDELNDPFDSSSVIKSHLPSFYFKDKDRFEKGMRQHLGDERVDKAFEREDWYDELLRMVARESDSALSEEELVTIFNEITMKQLLEINQYFNQMVHKMNRIACFTTKCDNLPMWSHYACDHTGVCMEYDMTKLTDIYILNRLFPVYYVSKLPDFVEHSMGKQKPEFSLMDYFLIHKLEDWAYEDEWRLLFNAGSWYYGPEDIPDDFWSRGKTIPFAKPVRVLLGSQIDEKIERVIRELCKKQGIEVVKMKCTEYGLEEEMG